MDSRSRDARSSGSRAGGRTQAGGGRLVRRSLLALALLALPGVAVAATVKGRIAGQQKLQNPVWVEARNPKAKRYTFREPSATVRADVRELTSYLPKELTIVAVGAAPSATKTAKQVDVAGGRTTPVTIVVAEGVAVQLNNKDPFPHKLYDVGGKSLPPTETLAGKSRTWTPPGPGKYEIRDQLVPSLRSWIVVVPNVIATTHPDKKGEFAIDLDVGTYKLRGYHNGEAVGQELEVIVGAAPAEQPLKAPLVVGELPGDAGGGG